ncbi:MAG: glycosyltransferase family 2 protein [Actinomycetes bacterium]
MTTQPAVTVCVPTFRRTGFLPGLVAALEAQVGAPPFEVVIVDNGSGDGTWAALGELVRRTPLALAALRLDTNLGPGPARNRAASHGRAPLLAFTDDDCLPAPGWVAALVRAVMDPAVAVVQGCTRPPPGPAPGTWARSVWVNGPTAWFETCNIAYRRAAFARAGGFDEADTVSSRHGGGRPFGEDAWLGARVVATGGRHVFAPQAVVHHRWIAGGFRDHLAERRHMRGFPGLVRRVPGLAGSTWGGVFLSRRTAAFDAALACTVAAVALRRPALAAGALPWFAAAWGPARARRGRLPLRLAQAAVADLAGLSALVEGSVRYRRLVL